MISKVYNASIAAVMNARGSTVQISNLECTKTSGKQAGVLISEKSDIELVNSVFKGDFFSHLTSYTYAFCRQHRR